MALSLSAILYAGRQRMCLLHWVSTIIVNTPPQLTTACSLPAAEHVDSICRCGWGSWGTVNRQAGRSTAETSGRLSSTVCMTMRRPQLHGGNMHSPLVEDAVGTARRLALAEIYVRSSPTSGRGISWEDLFANRWPATAEWPVNRSILDAIDSHRDRTML